MGVGNAELSVDGKAASLDRVARTTAVSLITATAPSDISSVFPDVPRDAGYAPAVRWAYEAAVTRGTDLGSFTPDRACTRAEAATFLWQALGRPTAASTRIFRDAAESEYYYQAALWAAGTGVFPDTDGALFSPDRTLTNGEFLNSLWQALGKPGENAGFAGYTDGVEWAAEAGLLGELDPEAPCRRRDAVEFLYRALA